jgi:hypothetical protein
MKTQKLPKDVKKNFHVLSMECSGGLFWKSGGVQPRMLNTHLVLGFRCMERKQTARIERAVTGHDEGCILSNRLRRQSVGDKSSNVVRAGY